MNDCGPDARRDHDALLDAARHVLAVDGAEPPLEEIARRDGVGIATLYRNFPTRRELLEAVYVHEVVPVGGRSRTERRR